MRIKSFSVATLLLSMSSLAVSAADPVTYGDPVLPVVGGSTEVNWTGFYAGVFGGYVNGEAASPTRQTNTPLSGSALGLTLGANYQLDQFVLGAEADIAWTGASGSAACNNTAFACSGSIEWMGSVRGRAGVAIDQFLLFGTAGVAVGGIKGTVSPANVGTTGTHTPTFVGWTAGLGAEYAVTENLRFKAEYSYTDFGSRTSPAGTLDTIAVSNSSAVHAAKIGFNFAF